MSKKAYKKIMFSHGGIVPAAFAKTGREERVSPFKSVEVEADYAQSLIDDRFAMLWSEDRASEMAPHLGSLLVEDATAMAKKLIDDAKAEAKKIIDDAKAEAQRLIDGAAASATSLAPVDALATAGEPPADAERAGQPAAEAAGGGGAGQQGK